MVEIENGKACHEKLTPLLNELASIVPLVAASSKKMDRSSILRLTVNYLMIQKDLVHCANYHDKWRPSFLTGVDLTNILLDTINGFLFVISSQGKLLYISERITQLLGYSQADVIGHQIFSLLHPCDHETVRQHLHSSVVQTPSPDNCAPKQISFSCRMINNLTNDSQDCKYKEVHVTGHIRSASSKKCDSISNQDKDNSCKSHNQDIMVAVGRIHSQQSIQELSIADASKNEYISRHDLDGRILFIDQRSARITGYLPSEVKGNYSFTLIHQDDLPYVLYSYYLLWCKGEISGIVYRLRIKSQDFIYLKSHSYISCNQENNKHESIVSVNTVLAKEDGEKELKIQTENLKPTKLFDSNFDKELDPEGKNNFIRKLLKLLMTKCNGKKTSISQYDRECFNQDGEEDSWDTKESSKLSAVELNPLKQEISNYFLDKSSPMRSPDSNTQPMSPSEKRSLSQKNAATNIISSAEVPQSAEIDSQCSPSKNVACIEERDTREDTLEKVVDSEVPKPAVDDILPPVDFALPENTDQLHPFSDQILPGANDIIKENYRRQSADSLNKDSTHSANSGKRKRTILPQTNFLDTFNNLQVEIPSHALNLPQNQKSNFVDFVRDLELPSQQELTIQLHLQQQLQEKHLYLEQMVIQQQEELTLIQQSIKLHEDGANLEKQNHLQHLIKLKEEQQEQQKQLFELKQQHHTQQIQHLQKQQQLQAKQVLLANDNASQNCNSIESSLSSCAQTYDTASHHGTLYSKYSAQGRRPRELSSTITRAQDMRSYYGHFNQINQSFLASTKSELKDSQFNFSANTSSAYQHDSSVIPMFTNMLPSPNKIDIPVNTLPLGNNIYNNNTYPSIMYASPNNALNYSFSHKSRASKIASQKYGSSVMAASWKQNVPLKSNSYPISDAQQSYPHTSGYSYPYTSPENVQNTENSNEMNVSFNDLSYNRDWFCNES